MNELEQLRDRVAELERIIGLNEAIPLGKLLRPSGQWIGACEPMAGILLSREFVGRETAFIALYGGRPEQDQPDIKIIDIIICRLRQALQPYQITVNTAWGRGYYMTAVNKAALRQLVARLRAEAA